MIAPDNDNITSYNQLEAELSSLLNRCNIDNLANTPDYLLAHYLRKCAENYSYTHNASMRWRDEGREDA